ncbi:MAG: S-adenosylmethionine synthetase N-terminal domain-containing protein [Candidatus Izemoplasmatales bacterium]
MFEKVNPSHPDKLADRIAGAVVDLAYKKEENPRIAVEVLIGHGVCHIIAETSVKICPADVGCAVRRIAGDVAVNFSQYPQDKHLSKYQSNNIRCGDNGIFKGVPLTQEQKVLSGIARNLYTSYPYDGKYIIDGERLIICQSNVKTKNLRIVFPNAVINPLGDWTGGTDVDTRLEPFGNDKVFIRLDDPFYLSFFIWVITVKEFCLFINQSFRERRI